MNGTIKNAGLRVGMANALWTVYGAVGLTSGAIACLIAPALLGIGTGEAFVAGFLLPTGPVYLFATSNHAMTRRLTQIKRWREDDLITAKTYDMLVGRVVKWYAGVVCPLSPSRNRAGAA